MLKDLNECMYVFEPVYIVCGLAKLNKKIKLVHPIIVFFKLIKDVCCIIVSPSKKDSLQKSFKAPSYKLYDIYDECV